MTGGNMKYAARALRNLGRLCWLFCLEPIACWREFEKLLDQFKREPK